jgi:hypothetical protein
VADDHLSFDAADPVAESNAHRDELRRQREDAQTLRQLMAHRNGRAWLYRILERCHIYASAFAPGEPETTFFRMGEENIGKQMMMAAMAAAPDLYMEMLAEARKEDERIALLHADEDKKRSGDDATALALQGFDLPAPKGWPGNEG